MIGDILRPFAIRLCNVVSFLILPYLIRGVRRFFTPSNKSRGLIRIRAIITSVGKCIVLSRFSLSRFTGYFVLELFQPIRTRGPKITEKDVTDQPVANS